MRVLLDTVILDVGPCLSCLGILLSSPFLSAKPSQEWPPPPIWNWSPSFKFQTPKLDVPFCLSSHYSTAWILCCKQTLLAIFLPSHKWRWHACFRCQQVGGVILCLWNTFPSTPLCLTSSPMHLTPHFLPHAPHASLPPPCTSWPLILLALNADMSYIST